VLGVGLIGGSIGLAARERVEGAEVVGYGRSAERLEQARGLGAIHRAAGSLEEALEFANGVEYGLTCSIWTNDVREAHRLAASVQAGFVWINEVSRHFIGTPFGGHKQSGIGREECIEELISFTQEKHIHVNLKRPAR